MVAPRLAVAAALVAAASALVGPAASPPRRAAGVAPLSATPLAFTSPRKVDEALKRNDPLLYLASRLIRDDDARRGIRSIYAWCRRADDVADEVGVNKGLALAALDEIEADLNAALRGSPRNAIDAALAATFKAYPALTTAPFEAMLEGMRSDLRPESLRFATWDPDLRTYCERVAGGVGLMLLPLLGAAPDPVIEKRAVDLGVAIQLTNVLRDVGADARDYDRVYLPLEDLESCGCDLEDVRRGRLTDEYKAAVRLQIARARALYASARRAVPDLPRASRLPVAAIVELLESIVDELEARDCDSLSEKLRPTTLNVARAVFKAWRQSQ